MKKRALISAVAGIALAGVLAVGFAACGGESAKSIKGEQVDETTWGTAMDFTKYENFKAVYTDETEMKMGDVTVTVSEEYTIVLQGENQYIKGTKKTKISGNLPDAVKDQYKEGEESVEYYINKDHEIIAKKDGNWAKITDQSERYKYHVSAESIMYAVGEDDYTKYEYNADQKGYVLKDNDEGCLSVVKIVDGKFKALYQENKEEGSGMSMSGTTDIVVTAYEGQTVEVPAVS